MRHAARRASEIVRAAQARPAELLDATGRPFRTRAYLGPVGIGGGRLQGGYIGARTDRNATKEWRPGSGSADGDTQPDLPALRARSADLARNAPIATGAVNTQCTSVVGTGLMPKPRLDRDQLGLSDAEADAWERQALRLWQLHAGTTAIDARRTHTFVELQDLVLRGALVRGDAFARRLFLERRGEVLATRVQLIEADRVCNPQFAPDTDTLVGGVARDAYEAPVGYHVLNRHPGDVGGVGTLRASPALGWSYLPAFAPVSGEREVLHIAKVERIGQTRGVPYLAAIIEPLKQLDRYAEAELTAAVLSAMFTVFVKSEAGGGDGDDMGLAPIGGVGAGAAAAAAADYRLGNGAIVDLAEGEDIEIANPARPNPQFDPFFVANVKAMGAAIELPFELLLKHFTASYSASRAALLEAWRSFRARRAWLVRAFCQPAYEWVITEAAARGLLSVPPAFFTDPLVRAAYCGASWTGPTMGQLNPVQEVTAAEKRVIAGFSTIDEETAELTGGDWERNHAQQVKERRAREDAGLLPGPAATSPVTGRTPPAPPAADEDEDEQDSPSRRDDQGDDHDDDEEDAA